MSNLVVELNSATAGANVDWSAEDVDVDLPATAGSLYVAADVGINLGSGIVVAAGSVEFSRTTSVSSLLAGAEILELSITGASLFVGVGGSLNATHDEVVVAADAIGFQASGVDIHYVAARTLTASYTGLELGVASLSLVGITGL